AHRQVEIQALAPSRLVERRANLGCNSALPSQDDARNRAQHVESISFITRNAPHCLEQRIVNAAKTSQRMFDWNARNSFLCAESIGHGFPTPPLLSFTDLDFRASLSTLHGDCQTGNAAAYDQYASNH